MRNSYSSISDHLRMPLSDLEKARGAGNRPQGKRAGSRSIEDEFVDVDVWDGFPDLMGKYMADVPVTLPIRTSMIQMRDNKRKRYGLESEIQTFLLGSVFNFVEEAAGHTLSQRSSDTDSCWNSFEMRQFVEATDYLRPDVVVHYSDTMHDKAFLCGELKFLTVDLERNFWKSANGPERKELMNPYSQVYGYMSMNLLRYGFITNGKVLRCLKRLENSNPESRSKLLISPPIRCDQHTIGSGFNGLKCALIALVLIAANYRRGSPKEQRWN